MAKYQYVAEDVYEEMVALNKAGARASDSAKRRLKQKLAQSMGLSVSDQRVLVLCSHSFVSGLESLQAT